MTEQKRSAIFSNVQSVEVEITKFREKQPTMSGTIDEELIDFLANRGLTEEQLIKVEDDKIDRHVILLMDDAALEKYIPSYGDRISTVAFCKRHTQQGKCEPQSRKHRLVDRLRQKLKLHKGYKPLNVESDNEDQTSSAQACRSRKYGNKNAKKDVRRVDMGWLNYDSSCHVFKVVRPKNGGGIRALSVSRSTTKSDLLQLGKSLFFPNNQSSLGTVDQFQFDLKDYQYNTCQDGCSVGQLYDTTRFKLLKLYLSSVKHDNNFNNNSSDFQLSDQDIDENTNHGDEDINRDSVPGIKIHSLPKSTLSQGNNCIVPSKVDIIHPSVNTQDTASVCQETTISSECYNADISTDGEVMFGPSSTSTPSQQDDTVLFDVLSEQDYNMDEMSLLSNIDETIALKVRRGNTMEDMIPAFSDASILSSELMINRVLPDGNDEAGMGTGVLKDTLTEFWGEFTERCMVGDRYKVPFVRHDYSKMKWEAVARVIVKGWQMVRYFPIFIAPAFMEEVLFSTQPVSLTDMFLQYLSEAEQSVISQAMKDYNSVDEDDILDVLNQYQCKKLPKSGNLVEIVEEIAHTELIQKPAFIAECWKPILRMNLASEIDHPKLLSLYQQLQPNVFKVQKQIQYPEHMSDTENEVARYLKKYIMGLDQEMLKKFLRFCTGFDIMPSDVINVTMVDLEGFARRPVAHTCGNILELPRVYDNFPEFRAEFNAVLNSNVWVMDIA